MACCGGRLGLLACVLVSRSAISLPLVRLLLYAPVSLVPFVPARGVVGRFMGYSARYLVGVGVSQNMPLNGILWLLTGIFGDGVCCLFSALPVASFSPVCPAFRLLSAAMSWRWRGCFPAVSWRKRCGAFFRDRGRFPLLVSWDEWRREAVCRAGRMASAGRRACLYRLAHPLPLGAGEYVRPAGVGSVGGEGVGVSSRFSLSRGPSSCHLIISVVIAFRLLVSLPPLLSPSCPMRVVIYHLRPMCFVLVLSAPLASVLPLCSRVVSYRLSPRFFDELGGAFFACLPPLVASLASCLVFLVPPSSCLCPAGDRSRCPRFRSSSPSSCSYLVAIPFVFSPRSSTSAQRGGGRLVVCLLASVLVMRAAG